MGKVILCGPSASGKDHARKIFETKGFTLGVSYTTRDPRPGEIEGVDYNFISKDQFKQWIKEGEWLEYDMVQNFVDGKVIEDYYGTTKDQFETYDLFIMTPIGINKIPKEYHETFVVLTFDIDKDIRTERMNNRKGWTKEKTDTRLEWEEKAFANSPADIRVTNPDF